MAVPVAAILPYILIALNFALTVVAVVLSVMLFFSVVPTLKKAVNSVTEGINQVTLATTSTVKSVQQAITSSTQTLQNVLVQAGHTLLVMQNGINSGVYEVQQVSNAITGALTPTLVRRPEPENGSAVYNVEKGVHANSSLMRHPGVISDRRTPLPRWYKVGGHLTDHTMLSSQAVSVTVRPRIHHETLELGGSNNTLSVRHTSVHEAQLTWRVLTAGPLTVTDPVNEPLRLYFPDPLLSGHTALAPTQLQDILISSNVNDQLVDVFFTKGDPFVTLWYREGTPLTAGNLTGTIQMKIQVHLLVDNEGTVKRSLTP